MFVIVYGDDLFVVPGVVTFHTSMNDQAFGTLEYQQLLALIKRNAQTEAGQRRVETLCATRRAPAIANANSRRWRSACTANRGVNWWFNELTDPAETIGRLRVEGAPLDPLAIVANSALVRTGDVGAGRDSR
jgi:dsDNA-specific endonuclease/ATPase MutS2